MLTNGPIQAGLQINHSCDVRLCVRPDHLYAGTQSQNMNDCFRRGRRVARLMKGEAHPRASLTNEEVSAIRLLYSQERCRYVGPKGRKHSLGRYTQVKLAQMFGVDRGVISSIVIGKNWTHVK